MCVCVYNVITIIHRFLLSQVVEGVGSCSRVLLNLYQVFLEYSGSQQDDEVCSNSVYGLGLLAANALPDMIRCGSGFDLPTSV